MADGQTPLNSMQANMGLLPAASGPTGMPTPSPGETSMRLMEQASQRIVSAQQTVQSASMMAAQTFGAQFQQRFRQAQAIQSFSPFQAQAMAGQMGGPQAQQVPGGGPAYLPSPLTMTPAQSGVFRPPMPTPTMPIPPMYTPPILPMPFHPHMPQPMFRTAWEQQAMTQDQQSNRMFSYGMQAPAVAGQAAGIGAGAYIGSQLLGGLGPMGRLAGAIGGGLLAGRSGVAETLGDFAQMPFRPAIETRQMGSAIQRMSQDWVVGGPQLHATGRGLTRQAGVELAGGIKDLSADSGFKEQTGGMFNRQDLMRMTQMSGQAGLMDMEQSVPQIKNQLRQVAMTVKRFMELTGDPDVTNIIREMGQMRQFGMTMPQINQAAENMRTFSRAAGTSVRGMREMGGMPGAAVYQGMGLTAGQGFEYGNYSLAMARQTVASGGVSPQQLALMGGVQGMAQRNMQAQAAFLTTPMFAAAAGQFGPGGWGTVDRPQGVGGNLGAGGMVNAAVGNMNAAVRRGGIGALASFPLAQAEIADEAASRMTPMEQTAQRFRMAMQTGQMLGLRGQGAFDAGARMMFGDEVASQMSTQMKSPQFWISQQQMFQRRSQELAFEQRKQMEENAPGFFGHIGGRIAGSAPGRAVGGALKAVGGGFGAFGSRVGETKDAIGNWFEDTFQVPEGVHRTRFNKGTGMTAAAASALGSEDLSGGRFGRMSDEEGGFWDEVKRLGKYQEARVRLGEAEGQDIAIRSFANVLPIGSGVAATIGGYMAGGAESLAMNDEYTDQTIRSSQREIDRSLRIADRAKRYKDDPKEATAAASAADKTTKSGTGGSNIVDAAGKRAAEKVKDYWIFENKVGAEQYKDAYIEELMDKEKIGRAEAEKRFKSLPKAEQDMVLGRVAGAMQDDPEAANLARLQEEEDRTKVYEDIDSATEKIQDYQEEQLDTLEEKLGVHGFFGDDSALGTFKDWAKEQSVEDVSIMAAMAGGGRSKMDEAERRYRAAGGTREGWEKKKIELRKRINKMDEDSRDMLKTIGQKGTVADVSKWAASAKQEGITKSLRSEKFYGKFSEFGGEVSEMMRKGGAGSVQSMDDFVKGLSDETLEQMRKAGGESAALARAAQKAKGGDKKAMRVLERYAARVGGEEVEDKTKFKAEGEEAQAAQRSADAAGEMAVVAENLLPASKDLRIAAKYLLDYAETERQIRMNS